MTVEFEPTPGDQPPPADPLDLKALLLEHWELVAMVGGLVLSPLLYAAFARLLPALALFLSSLALLTGLVFMVVLAWPVGRKITWQRRAEVWAYRAGLGLVTYLLVGVGAVLLLNVLSPRTVPLEWPQAARYVPFWPFYLWFVVGCEGIGPCPPPPG